MKGWYTIKAACDGTSANISIYEEIGGWGITAQQFSEDLKALGDISHISLHIHSPGGDVFDGIAIYSLLNKHPAKNGEMSPQDRKAWYQSENERLKFEKEERDLIPAEEVAREYAHMAKAMVQVLETLPDILERDCALTPAAVTRVQGIIDDLRDEMARQVADSESESGWPASPPEI